jgi:hypothetical protein
MSLSKNTTYTPRQLKALHGAARSAFLGGGGEAKLGKFDPWRRQQIHHVTGKYSFLECRQSDFSELMARFAHLEGRDEAAFKHLMHAGKKEEVERSQTIWHLDRAVAAMGSVLTSDPDRMTDEGRAYAVSIARDQFHRDFPSWESLLRLDAEDLTHLCFTLRKRAVHHPRPVSAEPF